MNSAYSYAMIQDMPDTSVPPKQKVVEPGERIAQFVITPFYHAEFEEAEELSETVRGEGGFGSTGAN